MIINLKREGLNLIVELKGELDHHSAQEVRNKVDDAIERDKVQNLIMSFEGVTFMDSSGIGVVIGRYKKLSMRGGKLVVTNINKTIGKVFELSGLYKIIRSYTSIEEAIRSI